MKKTFFIFSLFLLGLTIISPTMTQAETVNTISVFPPDGLIINGSATSSANAVGSTASFSISPSATQKSSFVSYINDFYNCDQYSNSPSSGSVDNCSVHFTQVPTNSYFTITAGSTFYNTVLYVTPKAGTPSGTYNINVNYASVIWGTSEPIVVNSGAGRLTVSVTSTATKVNGQCDTVHYGCIKGTSTNQTDGSLAWTWTCAGINGGNNASCSEVKALPAPTQCTATASASPNKAVISAWDNHDGSEGYSFFRDNNDGNFVYLGPTGGEISGPSGSGPFSWTDYNIPSTGYHKYKIVVHETGCANCHNSECITNAVQVPQSISISGSENITLTAGQSPLSVTYTASATNISQVDWFPAPDIDIFGVTIVRSPTSDNSSPFTTTVTFTASSSITSKTTGTVTLYAQDVDSTPSVSKTINVTINPNTTNNPPTVSAGVDKTITLPTTSTSVTGTATDSDTGDTVSVLWTQEPGGPKTATIVSPNSLTTNITGLTSAGTYTFKLTGTDNHGAPASDTMTVTVNANPTNIPPTVNAGVDKTITLPTSAIYLSGTATDSDGTVISHTWSQVGTTPSIATIAASGSLTTDVTGLTTAGVYTFRLSATDNGGATSTDDMTVTVNPAYVRPDLTAGAINSPLTVVAGVANTFGTNISNIGTASTSGTWYTLFQWATSSSGTGATDILQATSMGTIGAGGSNYTLSTSKTFETAGTYYMRACADKMSAGDSGNITELDENNNCGNWTAITVTASSTPSGFLSLASNTCTILENASTCNASLSWNVVNPITGAQTKVTKDKPVANTTVSTNLSGTNVSNAVSFGTTNFFLYHNNELLDTKSITASCASGTSWNGIDKCVAAATTYPDLTAGSIAPNQTTVGATTAFNTTVYNNSSIATGISFPTLFQKSNSATGATILEEKSVTTSALGANASVGVSANFSFSVSGTYYLRACADKSSASDATGSINEGTNYEGNNCGAWTMITVGTAASLPTISNLNATVNSTTEATLGATIVSDGGSNIRSHGTCIGTSNPPSDCRDDGNWPVAPFTQYRGALTSNTTYYYYAFAGNSVGTVQTPVSTFFTDPNAMTGTLTANPTVCSISLDESSCDTYLTWSVSNPITPSGSTITTNYPNANTSVYPNQDSGTNLPANVSYGFGQQKFFLYNTGEKIAEVAVGASCASGTWNGSKCVSVPNPPTATIKAEPEVILKGDPSELTWDSTNATSCTGSGFNTKGDTSGNTKVYPITDTTYTVTCNDGNSYVTASVTVQVTDVMPTTTPKKPIYKED